MERILTGMNCQLGLTPSINVKVSELIDEINLISATGGLKRLSDLGFQKRALTFSLLLYLQVFKLESYFVTVVLLRVKLFEFIDKIEIYFNNKNYQHFKFYNFYFYLNPTQNSQTLSISTTWKHSKGFAKTLNIQTLTGKVVNPRQWQNKKCLILTNIFLL